MLSTDSPVEDQPVTATLQAVGGGAFDATGVTNVQYTWWAGEGEDAANVTEWEPLVVVNVNAGQDPTTNTYTPDDLAVIEAGQQREASPGPAGRACLAAHDVGMPEQGVGRDDFLPPRMRPAVLDPVHWRGNGGTDLRMPERFARQDREIPGAAVLS